MPGFIMNNLSTIIISAVLAVVFILIIANMIKKKRAGKSVSCNCGCSGCPSASVCHNNK